MFNLYFFDITPFINFPLCIPTPEVSLHRDAFHMEIAPIPSALIQTPNPSPIQQESTTFHPDPTQPKQDFSPSPHNLSPPNIHYSQENIFTSAIDGPSSQQSIKKWLLHHPFPAGVPLTGADLSRFHDPSHPHDVFSDHQLPYGSPIPVINTSKILRICAQNTQHSF
jgi:hypothetical protein